MARAALVTGGSSGIGLAIARMLRDEAFDLTLVARKADRLASAAHELGAHTVSANVAEAGDCERLVREHAERWERLDVLVNSAGVGVGGRIEDVPVKRIDLQLDVNLRGLILVTRAALPLVREADGLVVNLASIAGTIPTPALPVYGATKAAVLQFTRSLVADGVRATALAPGFVDTPMASWTGLESEQMIQPDDCAEVVRMLLRLSRPVRIAEIVIGRTDENP